MRNDASEAAERLAAVHPSWFGEIEAGLLRACLDSRLGRRLLVRQLAEDGFGLVWYEEHGEGTPNGLVLRPARVRRLLFELGVHAYALPIREIVDSAPARRLRRVLGPFYASALEPVRDRARLPPAQLGELRIRLGTALSESDEAVTTLLIRQGQRELHLQAQDEHPALAEWVRLVCPRSERPPAPVTVLPSALVARVRARHLVGATEAA